MSNVNCEHNTEPFLCAICRAKTAAQLKSLANINQTRTHMSKWVSDRERYRGGFERTCKAQPTSDSFLVEMVDALLAEIGEHHSSDNWRVWEWWNDETPARAALLEMERQRDELTEYIHTIRPFADCYKGVLRNLGIEKDVIGHVKRLQARAEAAEQSLAQQRWIPVSEKLPPIATPVFGWTDRLLVVSRVTAEEGWCWSAAESAWDLVDGDYSEDDIPVTHWRELPPAPAEAQ